MIKTIDLNSDLGESFGQWRMGDDDAILEVVSSANVACGFHAGDPVGILRTLKSAKENNVVVGAHVSYPDLVGFGRRKMDIASHELSADVIYQIGALQGLAVAAGTTLNYVKPHGALYNTIANDEYQATAVIEGILAIDSSLALVGLAGSNILKWAKERGLKTIAEAFADRAYTSKGELVSRREAGAVLYDADLVAKRMLQLVTEGGVESIDGKFTPIQADSICVHGDSPGAVDMARQVKSVLQQAGITIRSFIHEKESHRYC
ncbi:LamB/YcsF family protein [Xenorhabdus sp. 42]|uniref:LamB/YcsF family protein n=1 Tax=Xenorhabdus szentirmaii TaxID=290112 RepID=UPI0019C6EF43|nr:MULTISPECIES: 5-oxoprolinase subunit PxpA [unclassified Xenorhabdus]MBD2781736.1 LamB/YcsF family protein [Xenorhabdus sp. 38]MBD2792900.1 LamB/YcsF family protein [Xenorhabdus sp. CUL]MBD2804618.1 LamB/YcsF family protein [Xenorhabdus sp. ZM]MBD2820121.1 LamB/YcsF family protein [Xenorhabdus sp. 42]MBD2823419.1 LamB/YcsF family protein [Xenorhabdus sp. 5]